MKIPTEPIGSIPRPPALIHAVQEFQAGRRSQESLDDLSPARDTAFARISARGLGTEMASRELS